MLRGQFRIWDPKWPTRSLQIVPNTVVDEGEEAFLKMMLQASNADVSAGGNFYAGLCSGSAADTLTLATLSGEPTATNGYARQAIERNGTGWPTIGTVNGAFRGLSKQVTFAASGGDFSASYTRLFLCNVSSGTSGLLFAISGALSVAELITDGNSRAVQYELFLD